jgi:hypothetical protein
LTFVKVRIALSILASGFVKLIRVAAGQSLSTSFAMGRTISKLRSVWKRAPGPHAVGEGQPEVLLPKLHPLELHGDEDEIGSWEGLLPPRRHAHSDLRPCRPEHALGVAEHHRQGGLVDVDEPELHSPAPMERPLEGEVGEEARREFAAPRADEDYPEIGLRISHAGPPFPPAHEAR